MRLIYPPGYFKVLTMDLTNTTIALSSIITSGVVATAGILVPALIHLSDRREDERLRLVKEKKDTYLAISEIIFLQHVGSEEKGTELVYKAAAQIALWSSKEVKEIFDSWIDLWQETLDPAKKEENITRANSIREDLRKQMAKEVQNLKMKDR